MKKSMYRKRIKKPDISKSILLILFFCTLSAFIQADTTNPLVLPIRVYTVESEHLAKLNAEINETQFSNVLEVTNQIWSQAGIRWELESFSAFSASNEAEQAWLKSAQSPFMKPNKRISVVRQVCELPDPLPNGWNLCVIGQFPNLAGGAFFYPPNSEPFVSWPLRDRKNELNPATLAHELGHALGLPHDSDIEDNLMTGGGNNMRRQGRIDDITITNEEIKKARDHAERRLAIP